jgi:peroxidase
VGRLDSKTASLELANSDIPTAQQGLLTLISKFWAKGLSATDMVALVGTIFSFFSQNSYMVNYTPYQIERYWYEYNFFSFFQTIRKQKFFAGSHTIGFARCANYRDRIYGDFEQTSKYNPLSEAYLSKVKETCPLDGGDDNISPMDYASPSTFDNAFYEQLIKGEGLLNSDQEMWSSVLGSQTSDLVNKYWADPGLFFKHFSDSMVKMGNITNPEGGEVRKNCRFINT